MFHKTDNLKMTFDYLTINIIIIVIIIVFSEDGRDSVEMIRSRYVQMRWCETTVDRKRYIGFF